MTSKTPFSLRIFLADGDPDGLQIVERSNWHGKALMFPRALYPAVRKRSEFKQTGVYLLMDLQPANRSNKIYIGEGDPVGPRLEDHFAKKDFWDRCVFFVAGSNQLNKAHVQFLESQLVSRARAVKQTEVENGNNPAEPTLSEADRADMAVFLQHILGVLPVLGIRAFEGTPDSPGKSDSANLICQGRGVKAIGDDTPQGFVIRAGSHAAGDEAPSLNKHFPNVTELRSKLVALGVLVADGKQLKFSQDYTFTSPSLASSIVLARSSNGRVDWKDSSGRTLRQIQEAQAKS